jgi:hypothetical protein
MVQVSETWHATYPDGPRDAEGLFVSAAGQLYVITKERADRTALYRFPRPAGAGASQLQLVARLPIANVTGADATSDGKWVVVRTNEELLFYAAQDLLMSGPVQPHRFSLRNVGEPQGEGVAVAVDGLVSLVGERGGGTFASIRCSLKADGGPASAQKHDP